MPLDAPDTHPRPHIVADTPQQQVEVVASRTHPQPWHTQRDIVRAEGDRWRTHDGRVDPASGQLVDPTIPSEPLFERAEEIRANGALVIPLCDPALMAIPHSVRRGRFRLTYDEPGQVTAALRSEKPLMSALALLLVAARVVQ